MIKAIVTGILGVILGFTTFSLWTQTSSCEEDIYSKIVPVGGIVTTNETENGEQKRSQGKVIILQRMDCKKCISSVVTDNEGKYTAYLSEGKYQITIRDCGSNRNEDCIAPNQSRFINVVQKGNPQFDIKLVQSKEDDRTTIPNAVLAPLSKE